MRIKSYEWIYDFCNGNIGVNNSDMRFGLMKYLQIEIAWIQLNMLRNLYSSLVIVSVEL